MSQALAKHDPSVLSEYDRYNIASRFLEIAKSSSESPQVHDLALRVARKLLEKDLKE